MRGLIIFGTNELAKLAHFYAVNDLDLQVLGFVVDSAYKTSDRFLSLPLFAWEELTAKFPPPQIDLFVAVGYRHMRTREAIYWRAKNAGYRLINIVSANNAVANNVVMTDNNFVMPGVVVEPGVIMGANNVIWSNTTVCHDCFVGSHNFIAAHSTLGGNASVGDKNFLGFSSVVLQGRRIGNETLVGAQSLVNKDTQDLSVYWGAPAKRISSIDPAIGVSVT